MSTSRIPFLDVGAAYADLREEIDAATRSVMTSGPFTPMLGPGSFGHAGAGGSLAFGHPEAEVGFAYAMNKMDLNLSGDARAHRLVKAVEQVLAG